MPSVVGNRKSTAAMSRGYENDPIYEFAKAFRDVARDILTESGVDIFDEPKKAMMYESSMNAMKNFFIENTVDEDAIEALNPKNSAEAIEEANQALEEQFANDREAVLEYSNVASMNPVIGMTFPLHKNILMNNIFDKGAIPKVVAREPKFTITMENRFLVTPDGQEIDIYKEQYKLYDAIEATSPYVEVELALPENETTDVLGEMSANERDNLDIDTYISAIKTTVYLKTGDINPETGEEAMSDGEVDVWLPTHKDFVPAYGDYDRTMTAGIDILTRDPDSPDNYITKTAVLGGYVKKNRFCIVDYKGVVTAVKLAARIDTSSAMIRTPSVKWSTVTTVVEIPSANPINTPISPDEIKDIAALYNTNQLAKIMSMIKLVLGNYKDDKIRHHLDDSFVRMPSSQKVATTFDFSPERAGYAFSPVQYRKEMFMDYLDGVVTIMLQVLNDPNMTITVFGAPELVRRVTPTEYTYQTPNSIGPVELDYTRTIVTSDKRVYQFIGSDKLRGTTNFIIVLCPRNSERIIYRIYDYQMYVSNEIRNVDNYALPAVHAFERWKFVEYQPVQGRVKILHPMGLTNIQPNDEPVQVGQMNDFNLLK